MEPEHYMQRCISLARLGGGRVAPNPMVGAVLVYEDRIIGEGWHRQYGEAHAEVNCIRDAEQKGFADLVSASTLYVALEPCAHFGKTPPCTELIIRHRIPRVVIGCRDPFPAVNGKGIDRLKDAGMEVVTGVAESECRELNKRFFCFHEKKRPYVVLKWAETADGFLAAAVPQQPGGPRLQISNACSNRLVHRWRSEEASILVGTNTALLDDPELTTRLWPGASPVRIVLDKNLSLPPSLKLFDQQHPTIVFNFIKEEVLENLRYYQLPGAGSMVEPLLDALYAVPLPSVLVEGGAQLLQSFIDAGAWDELRIIRNTKMYTGCGLPAPVVSNKKKTGGLQLGDDEAITYVPA